MQLTAALLLFAAATGVLSGAVATPRDDVETRSKTDGREEKVEFTVEEAQCVHCVSVYQGAPEDTGETEIRRLTEQCNKATGFCVNVDYLKLLGGRLATEEEVEEAVAIFQEAL